MKNFILVLLITLTCSIFAQSGLVVKIVHAETKTKLKQVDIAVKFDKIVLHEKTDSNGIAIFDSIPENKKIKIIIEKEDYKSVVKFLTSKNIDLNKPSEIIGLEEFFPINSIINRAWNVKMNQIFGLISTGQSDITSIANYVSVKPISGEAEVNMFIPLRSLSHKNVPFASFNIETKVIGDNTSRLFSDRKINSGVRLSGKLHVPIGWNIFTEPQDENDLLDSLELLKSQIKQEIYNDTTLVSVNYLKTQLLSSKILIEKTRGKISKYNIAIEKFTNYRDFVVSVNKNDEITIDLLYKDTLRKVLDSLISFHKLKQLLVKDSLATNFKIKNLDSLLLYSKAKGRILFFKNKVNIKMDKDLSNFETQGNLIAKKTLNIYPADGAWLSFFGDIGGNKYYTFKNDPYLPRQLIDSIINPYTFGVEFNYIHYGNKNGGVFFGKKPDVHILSLGIAGIKSSNLEELTPQDLTYSRRLASSDSTHTLSRKYSVYVDTVKVYTAAKFSLNYYYILGKENGLALHFLSDIELRSTKENPINLGLGLIMGFKNKSDNTTLNVELFGKITDLTKELPQTDISIGKRISVALNVGIPLFYLTTK